MIRKLINSLFLIQQLAGRQATQGWRSTSACPFHLALVVIFQPWREEGWCPGSLACASLGDDPEEGKDEWRLGSCWQSGS